MDGLRAIITWLRGSFGAEFQKICVSNKKKVNKELTSISTQFTIYFFALSEVMEPLACLCRVITYKIFVRRVPFLAELVLSLFVRKHYIHNIFFIHARHSIFRDPEPRTDITILLTYEPDRGSPACKPWRPRHRGKKHHNSCCSC